MRVAVLLGGISLEREGSFESGKNCANALRDAGYDVTEIDVNFDVIDQLRGADPDVVFNGAYGRGVEDGAIQGLLEWMRLPYTHSGVTASAIGMDKARSRAVFQAKGIPVAEGRIVNGAELAKGHAMDPPYVLKPNSEGSSIGIHYVVDADTPPPAPSDDMHEWFLVERYVPGLDLTVVVARDRSLAVTAIESASGVWDRRSKQHDYKIKRVTPALVPESITAACLELAERAHRALGCRNISRTDFRWDVTKGSDGLIVLETNTQPMVAQGERGIVSQQLDLRGHTVAEFCTWLVEDASLNR